MTAQKMLLLLLSLACRLPQRIAQMQQVTPVSSILCSMSICALHKLCRAGACSSSLQ